MEQLSPQLLNLFWGAVILAGAAVLVLTAGFTVLLGTTSHRNSACHCVVGVSLLAVAGTALVLLLTHR